MRIVNFLKKNRTVFIAAGVLSFLCFIYMIVNPGISIDEETWIQIEEPFAKWFVQGRWGIDLFNCLSMDGGRYAPVLWDILAILLWNAGGMLFSFALFGKDIKKVPLFFFQAYFCSLPFVMGEMFSFSMFSLQIASGMLSTAGGFMFSVEAAEENSRKKWLYALLMLIYAFSVYQAYTCVYVTAVVAYCLKNYLEGQAGLGRKLVKWAGVFAGGLIGYYGIYLLLMKLFGASSYLADNYVGWFDEGGIGKALFMAVANIARVSFAIPVSGEYIYGGEVIRIVTALFVIFAVWAFFKEKRAVRRLGVLFYTVALTAAPFVLYLALGTYKTHGRILLGLSLSGAVEIYLILSVLKGTLLKRAGIIAGAYLLFLNAKNMNILFYSANVAYEYDKNVANQIMYDIKRQGIAYQDKAVVFVGMEPMDNVGLQKSDTVGSSIFEWDDGNISRMCNFMKTEGYRMSQPTPAQIEQALELTEDMGTWPQENSIKETEDTVIVFLSEPTDKWYKINLGR